MTGRTPAVAVRRSEALKLRAKGMAYADIAEQLGVSYEVARKDVERGMNATVQEAGKELVSLETQRTEDVLAAAWGIIDNAGADFRDRALALREVTRILERRAKLLGLDATKGKGAAAESDEGETVTGLLDFSANVRNSVRLGALVDAFHTYAAALGEVLEKHNIPAAALPVMPDPDADYGDPDGNTYDPWLIDAEIVDPLALTAGTNEQE